jgi:hypothetical protein
MVANIEIPGDNKSKAVKFVSVEALKKRKSNKRAGSAVFWLGGQCYQVRFCEEAGVKSLSYPIESNFSILPL